MGTVRTWSTARFHRGEAVSRPDATLGTQLIGIASTTRSKWAPLVSSMVETLVLARSAYHDSYRRSSGDGRGLNAVLTDAGLGRLRRAWPTHLASVRRQMMDHLGDLDLHVVTAALKRFASDTSGSPGR